MIDYKVFLPHIASAMRTKKKRDTRLGDEEFRHVVANAFSVAVIDVARDTDLYIVSVPIHLTDFVKEYPVIPSAGLMFNKLIRIQEVEANLPAGASFHDGTLILPCCPEKNIANAYQADISVIPEMGVCEVHDDFGNIAFTAILMRMTQNLSIHPGQEFASLGVYDRLGQEYKRSVRKLRRESLSPFIKASKPRITHAASKATRLASCPHFS